MVLGLPNMFREGKLYNAVHAVTDGATRMVHLIPTTKEDNNLLADFRIFSSVYIDDIVIFSRHLENHLHHLRLILQKLRSEKLYAKRKTCSFAQDEIDLCGFLVHLK